MWRRILQLTASVINQNQRHKGPIQDVPIYPDDIFVVSYPRSGNTWVRFLLANLLRYDSKEPVDFHSVHHVIPDIEREAHWEMLRRMTSPRLIKSHKPYDSTFKRVIYILRDGRDVMVSYYYYLAGQGRFEGDFLEFLRKKDLHPCLWHDHVDSWLHRQNQCELLLIRYEELIRKTEIDLERMARFAGLPCERERLRWAISNSRFDAMLSAEKEKGRAFGSTRDFEFVRKGIVGDWVNHFESAHKQVFKSYANQAMLRLGYVDTANW